MKKIIFFSLLLLGAEKAVPKEIIDNIDLLKELDFFLSMDIIEKENFDKDFKDSEKADKKEKKDVVEISTWAVPGSSESVKIKLSTMTGRGYEK
ncbi:MAG: hypothetical protein N2Z60_01255 [Elusimicrobiales bacterium]|nr:hypothetical protein [Elusimicrobiales bacterium]